MALIHHRQMTEHDEDVDIREVQTAKVRRQGTDENWSAIVSITEAIRQAGLEDGGSFRFDPAAIEEIGMVPALGSDETVDGRTQPLTRNIKREGKRESPSLRLVLPDEVLEALGITDDEIGGDDPVEVTVWAGENLLGFERSEERTVAIDREDSASR
jgi:hypothetical protein